MRLTVSRCLTAVPVILLLLVIVLRWNTSGNGGETNLSARTAGVTEPFPRFIEVSSRTVDSDGADIAVGNIASPIDGLVVHVPPHSMPHADRLTLGYTMKSVKVRAGKACGLVITLRADTIVEFNGLVTIEVHYRAWPPPKLAIPYSLDAKGRLHVMNIQTFDAAQKTLTFYTSAPGDYTWVYE